MFVVADHCQSFGGSLYEGTDGADATLFSFGTLKTATAFGGGIVRVRDAALRETMSTIQDRWPEQKTRAYAARVAAHAGFLAWSAGPRCSWVPPAVDRAVLAAWTRPKGRYRPCAALRTTLARRLGAFHPRSVAGRVAAAQRVLRSLPAHVVHVGGSIVDHVHWAIPIQVPDPDAWVAAARARGVLATRVLVRFGPLAPRARALLSDVVFLPFAMWPSPMSRFALQRVSSDTQPLRSLGEVALGCRDRGLDVSLFDLLERQAEG
jgi:hypothetical protein